MKQITLPMKELETIAATRFMLGIGAGFLLHPHLSSRHGRLLGWGLLAIGVLSTPPLLYDVYKHRTHH